MKTVAIIGAGLLLQPQGLNVLNDLGILTEILQQGSQIDTLYSQNSKGTGRST